MAIARVTHITSSTVVACLVAVVTGCATTAPAPPVAGEEASVEGSIASIDTQPWAYDGNAIILIDTAGRDRIAVELPARWNLCKAAAVDVGALAVGTRVRATGTVGAGGEVVVCQRETHRLAPAD